MQYNDETKPTKGNSGYEIRNREAGGQKHTVDETTIFDTASVIYAEPSWEV
jgi:hypothetical protein